jgi:alginate O-acetyltransferase complex protein AlgI
MLFNSYEFLFLFLPVALIGYFLVLRGRGRLVFLTLMSYVFYGWWDYRFVSLMFLTTVIDYVAGLGIDRSKTPVGRRGWLLVSIVSGLALLGFFKYYELTARTTNEIATWFHGAPVQLLPMLHLILPIGISFYTFHSMSYTIDIYRGVVKPAERFWNFSCFVALFSQLVAGPIIRYRDMAEQLVSRTHTLEKVYKGIVFFVLGLTKKVILADGVAPLVGTAFDLQAPGLIASWVGVLSYAMQIYFDFSGYSDMAVGLGYLFGFQIPQNFNSPYKSLSITDFWRRWHMSLSTWLRDYLYVSLGGNRKGAVRTYINLFLTMLLGGLWHGANWTFVVWGGYHGLLLAIERATGKKSLMGWAPVAVQRGFAFLLVLVGWVLFRCDTLGHAGAVFSGMLGFNGFDASFLAYLGTVPLSCVMLVVTMGMIWTLPNTWEIRWRTGFWGAVALCVLFVVCVGVILVNSSSPFLYFQF